MYIMSYEMKYLKYKMKYLTLKNQAAGFPPTRQGAMTNNVAKNTLEGIRQNAQNEAGYVAPNATDDPEYADVNGTICNMFNNTDLGTCQTNGTKKLRERGVTKQDCVWNASKKQCSIK